MKKLLSVLLCICMISSLLVGCGSNNEETNGKESGDNSDVEIYFLNFKPEVEDVYKKIAEDYKKETGVTLKVVTAASGKYEETLRNEINKKQAPTIFQINGPVGYKNWADYCLDLSDSKLYTEYLNDTSLAYSNDDGVFGIPYAVEGYGIIYNQAIMNKYFALADKAVSISSTEEITSYDLLKQVAEDMQKHKADLGIDGVFANTSLKSGEAWRWQTHLANLPMDAEFAESATEDKNAVAVGLGAETIEFKYADNYKQLFDLYLNNSTCEPTVLGSKSVNDSISEFALGKCAMIQNGNWAWNQVKEVKGYTVKEEDVKMLPIYCGLKNEAKQGICIGTENYLCVNSQVDEELQEASIAFLEWLFNSETGTSYVGSQLGFKAPFKNCKDTATDPLLKEVSRWMENKDVTNVPWTFQCFPSENFKNDFGDSLLQYAQGKEEWNKVVTDVKEFWKAEYAETNS